MKTFCKCTTLNISKLNCWLVICIAKDFIWTTLKAIFSIFWFFFLYPQIPDSCISAKYCPILTKHTSMESLFIIKLIMYISQFHKFDPYDWFCGPGSHTHTDTHIYTYIYTHTHIQYIHTYIHIHTYYLFIFEIVKWLYITVFCCTWFNFCWF